MEEKKKIGSFTDLAVWKEGHKLVLLIYKTTRTYPKEEIYALTDQLRRATMSITNNIAEGFSRKTYKDKLHFYYLAAGSTSEVQNQLIISRDLKYISIQEYNVLYQQQIIVAKLLQGLIKKTKNYL